MNPMLNRLLLFTVALSTTCMADWPTHRANLARTGATDDQPLPGTPRVVWVFESNEHFIASPVIADNKLIVSSLGFSNLPAIYALNLEPAAKERIAWKKSPPALRQAVVCPPAYADGHLVVGDGMHQIDGGTLHCLSPVNGVSLWQLPVAGSLVHLEGSPTIVGGRVYIGGGAAGVLCVDATKLTLDGRPTDPAAAEKLIEEKWKELTDQYEQDKKKDPDFAIPPSENALPKPQPARLWQAGQEKMHVDTAVAVVGKRVLAGSAYLDMEKLGDRALYCLDADTGAILWRTPLSHNPWGGPTVVGDTVLVGCSNIRFDTKEISRGKGQVVALALDSGKQKWAIDIPGGVLSAIAVADGMAIFTSTDGRVRALSVSDGSQRWTYDGKAAFFAGPAVAGGVTVAGDLKGVVHAINLETGKPLWKLDLAADPLAAAPGMIYGSPVIHAGRIYVATSNLESGQQKTVVVCIGS